MGVVYNPLAGGDPFIGLLATGTILVQILLASGLIYYGLKKAGYEIDFIEDRVTPFLQLRYRELTLALVSFATAGSLYMSNFLGWTPCRLCWFQRVFIYPLVVIVGVGVLLRKDDVRDYVIPTALIGLPIALYHALLQRYEQFESAGCSIMEVSCETTHTFYFGYISVPVMAATALLATIVLMWRFKDK